MRKQAPKPETLFAPAPAPAWVRRPDARLESADAAFFAAGALASLDPMARAQAPFAGVWRQRLALAAAVASSRRAGRREAEGDLRDAWFLRAHGDALGPAGEHLQAWRVLTKGVSPSQEEFERAALGLGLGASAPLGDMWRLAEAGDSQANPVHAAAAIVTAVTRAHPPAEFLGLWLADLVLAKRLRWPQPVPLLAARAHDPTLRRAAGASQPTDEGWERLAALAYAEAAASAIDLARDLSRRAEKLLAQRAKLRAKGAGRVIEAMLADDAVAPAARIGGMSDRGMRRLVDRLVKLGVVRELTQRPTFRLYGL